MSASEDCRREEDEWRGRMKPMMDVIRHLERHPCRIVRFTQAYDDQATALVNCGSGVSVEVTVRLIHEHS